MSETKINSNEESLNNDLKDKNKNDSSSDSETDSSSEDECENEDNCTETFFNYTDNSDLFVVSVDGIPKFYVKDEKEASDKMWSLARLLSGEKFCSGYRTNYVEISPTELHIMGSYRFFLIAYDQKIHSITYSKIRECVN